MNSEKDKKPRKVITIQYAGEEVFNCRGCGTPIFLHVTPNGKKLPVNRETLEPHWGECPSASDFRKERTGQKQGRGIILKKEKDKR